jgi:hypothetical protein
MRSITATLLLLLSASALAQTPPSAISNGTIIEARLVKGVDSKKAKPGDQIEAETTWPVLRPSGEVLIAKGSRLIGHVTVASGPTLGLIFDSIRLKDGSQAVLSATIQGARAQLATEDVWMGESCTYQGNSPTGSNEGFYDTAGVVRGAEICFRNNFSPNPIERVSTEQREKNEALFRSSRKHVLLPKHAQLVLLVGSVDEICRAKGTVILSQPANNLPPPAQADLHPALVIKKHQVIGCANSASAWTDIGSHRR